MPLRNGVSAGAVPAPLPRRALPKDPVALAGWLIGKRVVRNAGGAVMAGRIVETEAYLADDPASHSYRGLSLRNASMFAARGHAYVYQIYGVWFCLNVAAADDGHGAAVLIRALEPLIGLEHMRKCRGRVLDRELLRGPGRLCTAFDIDRRLDGIDLCAANGALWLARGDAPNALGVSKRIGITKAAEAPLRFYERGSFYVSGPRALRS